MLDLKTKYMLNSDCAHPDVGMKNARLQKTITMLNSDWLTRMMRWLKQGKMPAASSAAFTMFMTIFSGRVRRSSNRRPAHAGKEGLPVVGHALGCLVPRGVAPGLMATSCRPGSSKARRGGGSRRLM